MHELGQTVHDYTCVLAQGFVNHIRYRCNSHYLEFGNIFAACRAQEQSRYGRGQVNPKIEQICHKPHMKYGNHTQMQTCAPYKDLLLPLTIDSFWGLLEGNSDTSSCACPLVIYGSSTLYQMNLHSISVSMASCTHSCTPIHSCNSLNMVASK